MTIGERIKYYRELIGMTQTELATKCHTSKQNIYKYENNLITRIPLERFTMIASVLGVKPTVLMGREDINSESDQIDQMRDLLKENDDLRMLLSASSKLDADDIKQLYRIASLMGKDK